MTKKPRQPINLAEYADTQTENLKGRRSREGYTRISIKGREVMRHRLILYQRIGPGEHPCFHCGKSVTWDDSHTTKPDTALLASHLDRDKKNNRPGNIVPSCNDCNSSRSPEQASPSLTFQGRTMALSEWADGLGITNSALITRLKRWSLEDALTRRRCSHDQVSM